MPSPTSRRIHIIDDDEAVRDSLAILLEIQGFDVACYDAAERFLEAGGDGGCIVTDAQMPGLTGVELIQALRARGDDRPIILITARSSAVMAQAALAAGATAVIEKPFSPDALVEELRRRLDGGQGGGGP
jgi:two-component system response regulator FixJ